MTELQIDLGCLAHNFQTIKSKLNADTKVIAVVKANAYGLGVLPIAKALEKHKADWLAVAYAQEGVALREAGILTPILVFYPQRENLSLIIDHQLEPALYSTDLMREFAEQLTARQLKNYPVHIKFNSGLNRIGLNENECLQFFAEKEQFPFSVRTFYSHLGASEDERPNTFTDQQIERFQQLRKKIVSNQKSPPLFHLLNSSGIFNYPDYEFDCVRTGISLYGFGNRAEWDKELRPIAKLTSPIVQIHEIEEGESVGYNQGWIAPKKATIGVLPIGHADGVGRQYGKGVGSVWINGKRAPIVGNVCMDMLMIDISAVDCLLYDRAVFFGEEYPATTFAAQSGTISYELLTSLSPRIQRVIV